MKNIHVLPTDKPSRLHYFKANKAGYYLYPNNELVVPKNPNCINQNIYITSDEEIKEGDWFVNFDLLGRLDTIYDPIHKCLKVSNSIITSFEVQVEDEFTILKSFCKKIILTTDQDLIADGVQVIDDEFLEWFVKNPSCEEVEIESKVIKDGVWTDLKGYVELPTIHSIIHKIIIPRTTQQIINEDFDGGLTMGQIIPKEEAKQVGEYQQELFNYLHDLGVIALQSEMQEIESIVLKMQQERMYSETDIVLILSKFRDMKMIAFSEWFEQFKKK